MFINVQLFCRKVIYGTEEALKKLAWNHGSEELKIGIHGVFTDLVSFV